ncbi:MAG: small basic protein [Candidatus Omnitrophica bacterium]|nr:small basic protein [Candidatus Omnitrophota bacterium]
MSQHPSLRSSDKDKQHRSVLKRYERIKLLKEKDKWKEEEDSVYGLPKVKITRFKVKKEKAAAAEGVEGAVAAPGAEAAAPSQATAKAAPAKDAAKPSAPDSKKPAK